MHRLLLLMSTSTYKAESFLAAAARLEVEVMVATNHPQALVPLHPEGNLAFAFDALEHAEALVRRAAAWRPFSAVVAADDDGVVLAAHLSEVLGLRHNSVAAARTALDKWSTRLRLQAAGIPGPRFRRCEVREDPWRVAPQVVYPCVLKPRHLSGSRGVIRADTPEQFVRAFRRIGAILASPDLRHRIPHENSILVEDYVPGDEVALEGLLEAGSLRTLAIFDKPDPLVGPTFQETIYVTPSRHAPWLQRAIEATVQQAVASIGLRWGPLHAEVRFDGERMHLLEAAPRSIGGLCSRALRFGDGAISLEEVLLRHALGENTKPWQRETKAAGVLMLPIPRPGILRLVSGVDAARRLEHVEDVRLTVPCGQTVLPPPEGARYVGFVFARAETPQEVEEALRRAQAEVGLDIEPLGTEDPETPVEAEASPIQLTEGAA